MKKINLMFGFLLLCTLVHGQTLFPIANEKGFFGFSDLDGNICIKHQYTSARPYEGDVAVVEKKGKWGIIDKSGNYVLPLEYTLIENAYQGVRRIQKGQKWGLADANGRIILDVKYGFISRFNCYGRAFVNTKAFKKNPGAFPGLFGIVDASGQMIIQPKYSNIGEFSQTIDEVWGGYAPDFKILKESDTLTTKGEYYWFDQTAKAATACATFGFHYVLNPGIVDEQGNELLRDKNCNLLRAPQSGMIRYMTKNKAKGYDWNYFNMSTGESMTVYSGSKPAKKEHLCNGVEACDFEGDLAFIGGIKRTNGYLINKKGEKVLDQIKTMFPPKDDYFVACNQQGSIGLFKVDGTAVFPYGKYKDGNVNVGSGYWGIMSDNNKWGVVDLSGNVVVEPEYDYVSPVQDSHYCYKANDKWGCRKLNGEDVVPCQYEDLIFCTGTTDNIWVKQNGLYYNFDVKTQKENKDVEGYKILYINIDGYRYAATTQCVADSTGYLINEQGVRMFEKPVPLNQFATLRKFVIEQGNNPISTQQGRYFLLRESRNKRSYTLNTKVPDNDWDY